MNSWKTFREAQHYSSLLFPRSCFPLEFAHYSPHMIVDNLNYQCGRASIGCFKNCSNSLVLSSFRSREPSSYRLSSLPRSLTPCNSRYASSSFENVTLVTNDQGGMAPCMRLTNLTTLFIQQPLNSTDAVGTIITDRPPHRTVRALLRIRLPPWMSGEKASSRIRMQNAWGWNPSLEDPGYAVPRPTSLTAAA